MSSRNFTILLPTIQRKWHQSISSVSNDAHVISIGYAKYLTTPNKNWHASCAWSPMKFPHQGQNSQHVLQEQLS